MGDIANPDGELEHVEHGADVLAKPSRGKRRRRAKNDGTETDRRRKLR
jgi:hypothetical protein